MSAWKLRHYYEAQAIKVLTNHPLNDKFSNRDSSRRISKWESQIMANFVAEWMEHESPWLVYYDGAWG
jgi:hypothetical protein